MRVEIAPASEADCMGIALLRMEMLDEEGARDPRLALEGDSARAYLFTSTAELIGNEFCHMWVAKLEGMVFGCICLTQGSFVGIKQDMGIRVEFWTVSSFLRHTDLGHRAAIGLMKTAYDFVRQNGYPRTQAVVACGNTEASERLLRNGYRLVASIYERSEVPYGTQPAAEAVEEVHPAGCQPVAVSQVGHAIESGVSAGSEVRERVPSEPPDDDA